MDGSDSDSDDDAPIVIVQHDGSIKVVDKFGNEIKNIEDDIGSNSGRDEIDSVIPEVPKAATTTERTLPNEQPCQGLEYETTSTLLTRTNDVNVRTPPQALSALLTSSTDISVIKRPETTSMLLTSSTDVNVRTPPETTSTLLTSSTNADARTSPLSPSVSLHSSSPSTSPNLLKVLSPSFQKAQLSKEERQVAMRDLMLKDEFRQREATFAPVLCLNSEYPDIRSIYHDFKERAKFMCKIWKEAPQALKAHYLSKASENKKMLAARGSGDSSSDSPGFANSATHADTVILLDDDDECKIVSVDPVPVEKERLEPMIRLSSEIDSFLEIDHTSRERAARREINSLVNRTKVVLTNCAFSNRNNLSPRSARQSMDAMKQLSVNLKKLKGYQIQLRKTRSVPGVQRSVDINKQSNAYKPTDAIHKRTVSSECNSRSVSVSDSNDMTPVKKSHGNSVSQFNVRTVTPISPSNSTSVTTKSIHDFSPQLLRLLSNESTPKSLLLTNESVSMDTSSTQTLTSVSSSRRAREGVNNDSSPYTLTSRDLENLEKLKLKAAFSQGSMTSPSLARTLGNQSKSPTPRVAPVGKSSNKSERLVVKLFQEFRDNHPKDNQPQHHIDRSVSDNVPRPPIQPVGNQPNTSQPQHFIDRQALDNLPRPRNHPADNQQKASQPEHRIDRQTLDNLPRPRNHPADNQQKASHPEHQIDRQALDNVPRPPIQPVGNQPNTSQPQHFIDRQALDNLPRPRNHPADNQQKASQPEHRIDRQTLDNLPRPRNHPADNQQKASQPEHQIDRQALDNVPRHPIQPDINQSQASQPHPHIDIQRLHNLPRPPVSAEMINRSSISSQAPYESYPMISGRLHQPAPHCFPGYQSAMQRDSGLQPQHPGYHNQNAFIQSNQESYLTTASSRVMGDFTSTTSARAIGNPHVYPYSSNPPYGNFDNYQNWKNLHTRDTLNHAVNDTATADARPTSSLSNCCAQERHNSFSSDLQKRSVRAKRSQSNPELLNSNPDTGRPPENLFEYNRSLHSGQIMNYPPSAVGGYSSNYAQGSMPAQNSTAQYDPYRELQPVLNRPPSAPYGVPYFNPPMMPHPLSIPAPRPRRRNSRNFSRDSNHSDGSSNMLKQGLSDQNSLPKVQTSMHTNLQNQMPFRRLSDESSRSSNDDEKIRQLVEEEIQRVIKNNSIHKPCTMSRDPLDDSLDFLNSSQENSNHEIDVAKKNTVVGKNLLKVKMNFNTPRYNNKKDLNVATDESVDLRKGRITLPGIRSLSDGTNISAAENEAVQDDSSLRSPMLIPVTDIKTSPISSPEPEHIPLNNRDDVEHDFPNDNSEIFENPKSPETEVIFKFENGELMRLESHQKSIETAENNSDFELGNHDTWSAFEPSNRGNSSSTVDVASVERNTSGKKWKSSPPRVNKKSEPNLHVVTAEAQDETYPKSPPLMSSCKLKNDKRFSPYGFKRGSKAFSMYKHLHGSPKKNPPKLILQGKKSKKEKSRNDKKERSKSKKKNRDNEAKEDKDGDKKKTNRKTGRWSRKTEYEKLMEDLVTNAAPTDAYRRFRYEKGDEVLKLVSSAVPAAENQPLYRLRERKDIDFTEIEDTENEDVTRNAAKNNYPDDTSCASTLDYAEIALDDDLKAKFEIQHNMDLVEFDWNGDTPSFNLSNLSSSAVTNTSISSDKVMDATVSYPVDNGDVSIYFEEKNRSLKSPSREPKDNRDTRPENADGQVRRRKESKEKSEIKIRKSLNQDSLRKNKSAARCLPITDLVKSKSAQLGGDCQETENSLIGIKISEVRSLSSSNPDDQEISELAGIVWDDMGKKLDDQIDEGTSKSGKITPTDSRSTPEFDLVELDWNGDTTSSQAISNTHKNPESGTSNSIATVEEENVVEAGPMIPPEILYPTLAAEFASGSNIITSGAEKTNGTAAQKTEIEVHQSSKMSIQNIEVGDPVNTVTLKDNEQIVTKSLKLTEEVLKPLDLDSSIAQDSVFAANVGSGDNTSLGVGEVHVALKEKEFIPLLPVPIKTQIQNVVFSERAVAMDTDKQNESVQVEAKEPVVLKYMKKMKTYIRIAPKSAPPEQGCGDDSLVAMASNKKNTFIQIAPTKVTPEQGSGDDSVILYMASHKHVMQATSDATAGDTVAKTEKTQTSIQIDAVQNQLMPKNVPATETPDRGTDETSTMISNRNESGHISDISTVHVVTRDGILKIGTISSPNMNVNLSPNFDRKSPFTNEKKSPISSQKTPFTNKGKSPIKSKLNDRRIFSLRSPVTNERLNGGLNIASPSKSPHSNEGRRAISPWKYPLTNGSRSPFNSIYRHPLAKWFNKGFGSLVPQNRKVLSSGFINGISRYRLTGTKVGQAKSVKHVFNIHACKKDKTTNNSDNVARDSELPLANATCNQIDSSVPKNNKEISGDDLPTKVFNIQACKDDKTTNNSDNVARTSELPLAKATCNKIGLSAAINNKEISSNDLLTYKSVLCNKIPMCDIPALGEKPVLSVEPYTNNANAKLQIEDQHVSNDKLPTSDKLSSNNKPVGDKPPIIDEKDPKPVLSHKLPNVEIKNLHEGEDQSMLLKNTSKHLELLRQDSSVRYLGSLPKNLFDICVESACMKPNKESVHVRVNDIGQGLGSRLIKEINKSDKDRVLRTINEEAVSGPPKLVDNNSTNTLVSKIQIETESLVSKIQMETEPLVSKIQMETEPLLSKIQMESEISSKKTCNILSESESCDKTVPKLVSNEQNDDQISSKNVPQCYHSDNNDYNTKTKLDHVSDTPQRFEKKEKEHNIFVSDEKVVERDSVVTSSSDKIVKSAVTCEAEILPPKRAKMDNDYALIPDKKSSSVSDQKPDKMDTNSESDTRTQVANVSSTDEARSSDNSTDIDKKLAQTCDDVLGKIHEIVDRAGGLEIKEDELLNRVKKIFLRFNKKHWNRASELILKQINNMVFGKSKKSVFGIYRL